MYMKLPLSVGLGRRVFCIAQESPWRCYEDMHYRTHMCTVHVVMCPQHMHMMSTELPVALRGATPTDHEAMRGNLGAPPSYMINKRNSNYPIPSSINQI